MIEQPFVQPKHRPHEDRAVLYPGCYVWFVFLSAMDLMMTWVILHFGGSEANAVAAGYLNKYGLKGFVIYKFVLVCIIVLICEYVGRRKYRLGRLLAIWSVIVTSSPILIAFYLLVKYVFLDDPVATEMIEKSATTMINCYFG